MIEHRLDVGGLDEVLGDSLEEVSNHLIADDHARLFGLTRQQPQS